MSKGISNIQIRNTIKILGDEDINDNFLGVFPSNHMNKFINHAAMKFEKKGKYLFVITNTDNSEKGGHNDGVYLISSQKQIFFLWIFWARWFKTLHHTGR